LLSAARYFDTCAHEFTEGVDTPDLKEANALLSDLI